MRRGIARLGLALILIAAAQSIRADPADSFKAGTDALQHSRWDEAARLLTQAMAERGLTRSDLALAHSRRGYAYFAKGQVDRAIDDYTQAIRLAPKDADTYGLRGWAHFVRGSMNRAIADSTAAIRLDPDLVFAYRNRGRAQLYSGRARAAADDFAQAVRLGPSDALSVIWLHVARARSGQNDADEFRTNVERINRREWPGTLLDVATGTSSPEQVGDLAGSGSGDKARGERVCDARVYLGLLELVASDKARAQAYFKAATEDCPTDIAEITELTVANLELKSLGSAPSRPARMGPEPEVASSHQDRGNAYLDEGQTERAIAEYGSAIRLAPNDPVAHHARALAYFSRGAMKEAIADASAAIGLDPNSAVALRVRGLAHLYAGHVGPAEDDFAAAVRLLPSDPVGVIWLHVARARAGHEDTQELRVNVAKVDAREWPGPLIEVLTGGKTMKQLSETAGSISDEKLRRDRVCDVRVYAGLLQLAAGDKQEARKLFGAAVTDCPHDAAEAAELAVAKTELKRLGGAPGRPGPGSPNTPVAEHPD